MTISKKWILVILAIIIILLAAVFLFSPKIDTDIDFISFDPSSENDTGEVLITLKSNETINGSEVREELENKTVFLNLTDSKNRTKEYNSTTDNWGSWKVWNIKPGKYNYSVIFPGDNEYNPSSENGTLTIKKYVPSNTPAYYYTTNNTTYYTYRYVTQPRYVVRYVYV